MATGLRGDDAALRADVLRKLAAKKVASQRGVASDVADRPAAMAGPQGRKAPSIAAVQARGKS